MKSGFDAGQCNPRAGGQIEAHRNRGIKAGASALVVLVGATCKVKGTLASGCPNRGRKKTSQEVFDWFL